MSRVTLSARDEPQDANPEVVPFCRLHMLVIECPGGFIGRGLGQIDNRASILSACST